MDGTPAMADKGSPNIDHPHVLVGEDEGLDNPTFESPCVELKFGEACASEAHAQPTPPHETDPVDSIPSTLVHRRRMSVRTYKFGEDGASEGSEVFEFRPEVGQESPEAMGVFGARKAGGRVMGRVSECSSEPGEEEESEHSAATTRPQSPSYSQIQSLQEQVDAAKAEAGHLSRLLQARTSDVQELTDQLKEEAGKRRKLQEVLTSLAPTSPDPCTEDACSKSSSSGTGGLASQVWAPAAKMEACIARDVVVKLLAEMEKRDEAQQAELAYCNSQLEASQRLLMAKDNLLDAGSTTAAALARNEVNMLQQQLFQSQEEITRLTRSSTDTIKGSRALVEEAVEAFGRAERELHQHSQAAKAAHEELLQLVAEMQGAQEFVASQAQALSACKRATKQEIVGLTAQLRTLRNQVRRRDAAVARVLQGTVRDIQETECSKAIEQSEVETSMRAELRKKDEALANLHKGVQSLQRDLELQQFREAHPASHDEVGIKLPAADVAEGGDAEGWPFKHRRAWSIGEDPTRAMHRLRLTEKNLTAEVAALQEELVQREKDLESATRNNAFSASEQSKRSASLAAEVNKLQMELVRREEAKLELLAQHAREQQEMRDELARLASERLSAARDRAVGERVHLEQQTKVGLHMQHNQAKLESLLQRQMEAEEEHAHMLSEMQSALVQSEHDALEATSQMRSSKAEQDVLLEAATARAQDLSTELFAVEAAAAHAQARAVELEVTLADVQTQLEQSNVFEQHQNEQMLEMRDMMISLQEKAHQTQHQMELVQRDLQEQHMIIAGLQAELEIALANTEALQQDLDEALARAEAAQLSEERSQRSQVQVLELEAQLAHAHERAEAAQAELEENIEELDGARGRLAEERGRVDWLQAQLQTRAAQEQQHALALTQMEHLEADASQHHARTTLLNEKLTKLQAEVLELQRAKAESTAAFAMDRGRLQDRLLVVQADAQAKEIRLVALTEEVQLSQRAFEETQRAREQALGSQLEEVRAELQDARQELAAAESSAQEELLKVQSAFAQEKQAGMMHLEKLRETTLEQSTLRRQVAALERGAAALETSKAVEAETLRKQVEALGREAGKLEAAKRALEDALAVERRSSLQRQGASKAMEDAAMLQLREAFHVERAGLMDKLEAARAHLKSKAEVIDAHVAEITWLTSQLEQTQARGHEREQHALAEATKSFDTTTETLRQELSHKAQELEVAKAALAEQLRTHTLAEQAHASNATRLQSSLLEVTAALQQQTDAKEAALSDATAQHVRAASLESALQHKSAEVEAQAVSIDTLQVTLGETRTSLDSALKDASAAKVRLSDMQVQVENLQWRLQRVQAELQNRTMAHTEVQQELLHSKQQSEDLALDLEGKLADKSQALQLCETKSHLQAVDMQGLHDQLDAKDEIIQAKTAEVGVLRDQLEAAEQELVRQLEHLREQLANKEAGTHQSKQELAELQATLEEVRAELEVSRSHVSAAAERETENQQRVQAMEAAHAQDVAAVQQRVAKIQEELEARSLSAQMHAGEAAALKEALAVARDEATSATQAKDTLEAACAELRSGKQAVSDACLATKMQLDELTAIHQSELSKEQDIQIALKGHLKVKDEVIASHVAEIEWLTEQLDLAQERAVARESLEAQEHDSDQKRLWGELDAAHAAADVAKQRCHELERGWSEEAGRLREELGAQRREAAQQRESLEGALSQAQRQLAESAHQLGAVSSHTAEVQEELQVATQLAKEKTEAAISLLNQLDSIQSQMQHKDESMQVLSKQLLLITTELDAERATRAEAEQIFREEVGKVQSALEASHLRLDSEISTRNQLEARNSSAQELLHRQLQAAQAREQAERDAKLQAVADKQALVTETTEMQHAHKQEMAEMSSRFGNVHAQVHLEMERASQLQTELEVAAEAKEVSEQDHKRRVAELDAEIFDLRAEVADLDSEVNTLRAEVAMLQKSIQVQHARADELSLELERLAKQLQAAHLDIEQREAELAARSQQQADVAHKLASCAAAHSDEIAHLSTRLEVMREQARDAATASGATQRALEEACKQLEDRSRAAQLAETALVRMQMERERDVQTLQQGLQDAKAAEAAALQTEHERVAHLQGELASMKEEATAQATHTRTLHKQLDDMHSHVQESSLIHDSLRKELGTVSARLQQTAAEAEEARTAQADMERSHAQELASLMGQLKRANAQVTVSEQENKKHAELVTAFNQQLEAARELIHAKESQRSAAESAWTEERASLEVKLEAAYTELEDVKADKAGTETRLQGEVASMASDLQAATALLTQAEEAKEHHVLQEQQMSQELNSVANELKKACQEAQMERRARQMAEKAHTVEMLEMNKKIQEMHASTITGSGPDSLCKQEWSILNNQLNAVKAGVHGTSPCRDSRWAAQEVASLVDRLFSQLKHASRQAHEEAKAREWAQQELERMRARVLELSNAPHNPRPEENQSAGAARLIAKTEGEVRPLDELLESSPSSISTSIRSNNPQSQAPATAASSPERPSQFTAFTNPYFDTPTSIYTKIVNSQGRRGVAPNAQTPGIKDTAATGRLSPQKVVRDTAGNSNGSSKQVRDVLQVAEHARAPRASPAESSGSGRTPSSSTRQGAQADAGHLVSPASPSLAGAGAGESAHQQRSLAQKHVASSGSPEMSETTHAVEAARAATAAAVREAAAEQGEGQIWNWADIEDRLGVLKSSLRQSQKSAATSGKSHLAALKRRVADSHTTGQSEVPQNEDGVRTQRESHKTADLGIKSPPHQVHNKRDVELQMELMKRGVDLANIRARKQKSQTATGKGVQAKQPFRR